MTARNVIPRPGAFVTAAAEAAALMLNQGCGAANAPFVVQRPFPNPGTASLGFSLVTPVTEPITNMWSFGGSADRACGIILCPLAVPKSVVQEKMLDIGHWREIVWAVVGLIFVLMMNDNLWVRYAGNQAVLSDPGLIGNLLKNVSTVDIGRTNWFCCWVTVALNALFCVLATNFPAVARDVKASAFRAMTLAVVFASSWVNSIRNMFAAAASADVRYSFLAHFRSSVVV